MGNIPCSQNCRFQNEGHCELNKPTFISSVYGKCPHFCKKNPQTGSLRNNSIDNSIESLADGSHADDLD